MSPPSPTITETLRSDTERSVRSEAPYPPQKARQKSVTCPLRWTKVVQGDCPHPRDRLPRVQSDNPCNRPIDGPTVSNT